MPSRTHTQRARSFVFVLVGDGRHAERLAVSWAHLRHYSQLPIRLVTDLARTNLRLPFESVIDVRAPRRYTDKQASRWIKTSLHKHLDLRNTLYCYLDCDVVALSPRVDAVFDHWRPPVVFGSDHCQLKRFASAATPCPPGLASFAAQGRHFCRKARELFGVRVSNVDWRHFNGGVFLFGKESTSFMNTWHRFLRQVLSRPDEWAVRDQGALIGAAWACQLTRHPRLPIEFNYIADVQNRHLRSYRDGGYSHTRSRRRYYPSLLHVYHRFGERGWAVWESVERHGLAEHARRRLLPAAGRTTGR